MKYMLTFTHDAELQDGLTDEERNGLFNGHGVVSSELAAEGKLVCMDRLYPPEDAVTIREQNGTPTVIDGPFAEMKEVLGGYTMIDVESEEEAIAWAKKYHAADVGGTEVRPVRTGAVWRRPAQGRDRYMLLFIVSDATAARQSKTDVYNAIDLHYELSLELAADGKFVASRSLEHPAKAKTVRRCESHLIALDGPFAESQEYLAGFFVIACDSKEEAITWGKKLLLGVDAVEVRPIRWE